MAAPHLTTLPDDVLREIFLWAIAFAEGRLWIEDAPLNLSHACRSLRAFALSQSCFWARLNLEHLCYANVIPYTKFSQPWISLWLERSGNALLDISMYLDEGDVAAAETITMLVAVQSRWKRMWFFYRNEKLSAESYDWTVTDLSQLRELEVYSIISNASKELQTSLLINEVFKLSTIAQTQTPIAPRLVHLLIEVDSTNLSSRTSPESLKAMLDHCPALECLIIGFRDFIWPAREGKGIVGASGTLNRLSHISITQIHCVDLLSFLNDGRAPALGTMEFWIYYEELRALTTTLLSPHIGPFIRRATLKFACDWPQWPARPKPGNALDNFFRALPNVTHLHLTVIYKDYVLERLSFGETGRLLLPELEYLQIVAAEARVGSLESMLTSRMLHSDRFRAVLDSSWDLSEHAVFLSSKVVRSWVESGRLEVIFSCRKLSVDVLDKIANYSGRPTSSKLNLDAMVASIPKGISDIP